MQSTPGRARLSRSLPKQGFGLLGGQGRGHTTPSTGDRDAIRFSSGVAHFSDRQYTFDINTEGNLTRRTPRGVEGIRINTQEGELANQTVVFVEFNERTGLITGLQHQI